MSYFTGIKYTNQIESQYMTPQNLKMWQVTTKYTLRLFWKIRDISIV